MFCLYFFTYQLCIIGNEDISKLHKSIRRLGLWQLFSVYKVFYVILSGPLIDITYGPRSSA